jgi:hypothetical protein
VIALPFVYRTSNRRSLAQAALSRQAKPEMRKPSQIGQADSCLNLDQSLPVPWEWPVVHGFTRRPH